MLNEPDEPKDMDPSDLDAAEEAEAQGGLEADLGLEIEETETDGLLASPREKPNGGMRGTEDLRQPPSAGEQAPPSLLENTLDAILETLHGNRQRLELLQEEFESKLKYDAHKERIIDTLHGELQEYKNDVVKKHLMSVLLDIIKVIDDIRKWTEHYRSLDPQERDPLKIFKYLENIPSDLEDIFYWQGVKPFTCEGEAFDPTRQRAVKRIDTADESMDKTVALSLRVGYEWEHKVIRPEMVAVYQYKPAAGDAETRSSDE